MFDTREKKERSVGVKLFLKAHRCNSPKCVTIRRPQRPGLHGKAYKTLSEFGQQQKEKQRIRFTYGLREVQMKRVVGEATKNPGVTGPLIISLLERRLDNTVYRLGFAPSRSVARQLVNHGHILVNSRKVTVSSYRVKTGETITIRPRSKDHPVFKESADTLKKYEPPVWLAVDAEKMEGKVLSAPKDFDVPFDVNLVVDYYSK